MQTPFGAWACGDEDAFVAELGLSLDFPRILGADGGLADDSCSLGMDRAPRSLARVDN
jgi:hypothetical protein